MADELGEATRALKRALVGQGHVIRQTGVKGVTDFVAAFESHPKIAVFIELKHDNTKLHPIQAVCLDTLHRHGLVSLLLNYRADKTWAVYRPPFLNDRMQLRSLRSPDAVLDRLTGASLIGVGGRINERLGQKSE